MKRKSNLNTNLILMFSLTSWSATFCKLQLTVHAFFAVVSCVADLQLPGMHKKGITCLARRVVSDTIAIFASTSSHGIVVIWEMAIEPTPSGKNASLWIDNNTVRILIFCHAGLTIQIIKSSLSFHFSLELTI